MNSLFGTDGIRATVGTFPLKAHDLLNVGTTLGHWFTTSLKASRIIIAHDTRISCPFIKATLKSGLLLFPLELYDAHVLATPALFYQVTKGMYDAGIMITASHNPFNDNGIKIFTKKGKLSHSQESILSELFHHQNYTVSYANLGIDNAVNNASYAYTQSLFEKCTPQFLKGLTLVVDCAHGAYSSLAPSVFERLGARVIALHQSPTGKNINEKCGSLHPELLAKKVIEQKANLGIAFDGDGDRVVIVSKNGTICTGDDILALLLNHPAYAQTSLVVSTLMANQGFENHLRSLGKSLLRTGVGDKYVFQAMKEHGSLLGGEPSGHIILRDFTDTADGLFTALRILQVLIATENWECATFEKMPQITLNVPVSTKKDLSENPYCSIIDFYTKQLQEGRLLVRYSGTESVLRIMIEDKDPQHAYDVGKMISQHLSKTIESSL